MRAHTLWPCVCAVVCVCVCVRLINALDRQITQFAVTYAAPAAYSGSRGGSRLGLSDPKKRVKRLWPLAVKLVPSFRRIIGLQKTFLHASSHPSRHKRLMEIMHVFVYVARGERRFMTACNKSHTDILTHKHSHTRTQSHS